MKTRYGSVSRITLIAIVCGILTLAPPSAQAQIALEEIVTGLNDPIAIAHAGDGSDRLFIVEQSGTIRIWDGSSLLQTSFLDISTSISSGGERGLLGLAFHPQYVSVGRFFVFYTDPNGDLVVAEHSVSADPNVANATGQTLITVPHPGAANHNGGQLAFGPDGYLYVATGDGGGGGDQFGNGQNLETLLGKILRLDVDGMSLIPQSNPFVDGDPMTADEIWSYGLRNPWRFSFDRSTGDMFIGDVGQGCWEEVDHQPAGSNGGANYAWPVMEGDRCYSPPGCTPPPTCVDPSYATPIVSYSHSDPSHCAIVGGYVYRGSRVPSLAGTYLYADYCAGKIWGATESGGVWTPTLLLDTPFLITSFGEDEMSEVFVADGPGGRVLRVTGAPATPFSDDFADLDASDWTPLRGAWEAASGSLANAPRRKSVIVSPYAGCGLCTVEATLNPASAGSNVSLIAWRSSKKSYVELRLMEKRDRAILTAISRGRIVGRTSTDQTLLIGAGYDVRLVYDGSDILAFIDGDPNPTLVLQGVRPNVGTVGFRVKGTKKRRASGWIDDVSIY